MNLQKLKKAERDFLAQYPYGFADPGMLPIVRKHRADKLIGQVRDIFAKPKFKDADLIVDTMAKVVSRSSLVSVFEKPKFRDFVKGLDGNPKHQLVDGLKHLLHGRQQQGFEQVVGVLALAKLAKWSLVTVLPSYYAPDDEVFVKPTTAKGVIEYFQLEDLHYQAFPTWEFYAAYREAILTMRKHVATSLTPSNAAFCGFLMMSLPGKE